MQGSTPDKTSPGGEVRGKMTPFGHEINIQIAPSEF